MTCKASVLMSLFYKESPEYLETTLSSLANQTRKADEIIVVIEGILPQKLTDILNKWEQYFGKNVLILVNAKDEKGFVACLNLGLKIAKNEIIIRIDTDDFSQPNRIEVQMAEFEKDPNLALLSGQLAEYDENLKGDPKIRRVPLSYLDILKYAKMRNPINHPTAAYRRKVALDLGSYPNVGSNEDYALFTTFFKNNYYAINLDSQLVKARTGNALYSRRRGEKYLKGELECLKYIYKIGFFSYPLYQFHIISRIAIRKMPVGVIRFVYKFLR
jgi:glycosyltransferase involved in cell wall biosynthesis